MSDNLKKYIKRKAKEKEKMKIACKKFCNTVCERIMDNINSKLDTLFFEFELTSIIDLYYDPLEAVNYTIKKLSEDKYYKKIIVDIKIYDPNILYIKWDIRNIT